MPCGLFLVSTYLTAIQSTCWIKTLSTDYWFLFIFLFLIILIVQSCFWINSCFHRCLNLSAQTGFLSPLIIMQKLVIYSDPAYCHVSESSRNPTAILNWFYTMKWTAVKTSSKVLTFFKYLIRIHLSTEFFLHSCSPGFMKCNLVVVCNVADRNARLGSLPDEEIKFCQLIYD